MESILQRFNAIHWHDSKLLGLSFCRKGTEDQVTLLLRLRTDTGSLAPTEMIFNGSTYIELRVDLAGKRVCSDDISDAECYVSSEWIRTLSEHNPHDNFDGYLHFEIDLIPPGGRIRVLAKDFTLGMPTST